jgi:hypothetical protein
MGKIAVLSVSYLTLDTPQGLTLLAFGRASTILPRGCIPSEPFGGIAAVLGAAFAGFHDHENRQSTHQLIINGYNI